MEFQWLKQGSEWVARSNAIGLADFLKNEHSTDELGIVKSDKNKPVIYVPTHNIHDVFEWFRIFGDVHRLKNGTPSTANFDKFGHWIHAYFDKERAQSIRDFFPNLVEVKATSSETLKYYDDKRSSVDFLDLTQPSFANLILDGVQIYENEKILLKNQSFETLNPDAATSSDSQSVTILYYPGCQEVYASGTSIRMNVSGTWSTVTVLSNGPVTVSAVQYLVILLDAVLTSTLTGIGSIENGDWTTTSSAQDNGIYSYDGSSLTRIVEMSDPEKVYNQIVYCYQGLTQENFEFYLRRNEDSMSTDYSYYPNDTQSSPSFNYSKGEAYLIKTEFDYTLDLLVPLHPSSPYNALGNEDCYRVALLDYDTARKVMLTGSKGLGNYVSVTSNLGTGFYGNGAGSTKYGNITFSNQDSLGNYNVIKKWIDSDYYNVQSLTGVYPTLTFRSLPRTNALKVYSRLLDSRTDTISYVQNTNTTSLSVTYTSSSSYISTDSGALNVGDLISLAWQVEFNTNPLHDFLSQNFMVVSKTLSSSAAVIEIFPRLDDNIVNELKSALASPTYQLIQIDLINAYGQLTAYSFDTEIDLLQRSVEMTRLKDIYQLEFGVTSSPFTQIAISTVNNIPGLSTSSAQNSNYGYTIASLSVGDLVAVINQTDLIENGIYSWNGLNLPMKRLSAVDGSFYHTSSLGTNMFKTYQIHFSTNPANPTLPLVSFTDVGNLNGNLTVSGIKQSHPWKWSNHAFQLLCADSKNFDNAYNQVGDVYGADYSLQKYLDTYMNDVNTVQKPNIDIAQLQPITELYNDAPGASRLGFELNKIYFGSNYKEVFLNNLKRHTYINIVPAVATSTLSVQVSEIYWDYVNDFGVVELYHQFSNAQVPAPSESVVISTVKALLTISSMLNDTDNSIAYRNSGTWHGRTDSAGYAQSLMNYVYDTGTSNFNDNFISDISVVMFKELGEPRLSLRKRDSKWPFKNDLLSTVSLASTANVNVSSPPSTIDSVTLTNGMIVLLKNQTVVTQNGIYLYSTTPSNNFSRASGFDEQTYYKVSSGTVNAGKSFRATFLNTSTGTNSLVYGLTQITFYSQSYSLKKDSRLQMRFTEIAKLGVDNLTQPWQKINAKYDSIEQNENQLNIQIGINGRRRIRFIDGLTESNIQNNIAGQGQYDWILDDSVVALDAVVGCTQTSGPGTGDLVWYTGTWSDGTWVGGNWIQGTWLNGTWLDGTWNAYKIQDYYSYVIIDTSLEIDSLSVWTDGTWTTGTWMAGTWLDGNWLDGTWVSGIWTDGTWSDGSHYCGTWSDGTWVDGNWYGGDFERGEWLDGKFGSAAPSTSTYLVCNPRFGTNASSAVRAVWRNGTFVSGDFMSGLVTFNSVQVPSTDHRAAVWFAGEWVNGTWWGGTFVTGFWTTGLWKDGIWFGGYYCTVSDISGSTTLATKQLGINPNQYLSIIGISNSAHNLQNFGQYYHYLMGTTASFPSTPAPSFAQDAYINLHEYYSSPSVGYVTKSIDFTRPNNSTTLFLKFGVAASISSITYQTENVTTGAVNGSPFIAAVWNNGTWENGTWLNGVWLDGIFKRGVFANGYWSDGTFGEI